jgi:zinc protease
VLKEEVTLVYKIVLEALDTTTITLAMVASASAILKRSIQRSFQNPTKQTAHVLLQTLYPPSHPYHPENIQDDINLLEQTPSSLILASLLTIRPVSHDVCAVGDIDHNTHLSSLMHTSVSAKTATLIPQYPPSPPLPQNIHHVSERKISPFRVACPLQISPQSPHFWPLLIAIDALGGTFSARLMQKVRDQKGLCYGIYAHLNDVVQGLGGYFSILTFIGPENIEYVKAMVTEEITLWIRHGLREEELMKRKEGLIGGCKVRAVSTEQLASSMRYGLMWGFGCDYDVLSSTEISHVSLQNIQDALEACIHPEHLIIVSSGPKHTAPVGKRQDKVHKA